MPDHSPGTLNEFNRQVLLLQDEAFTLAFHLLDDENAAAEVTQRAFLSVYQHQVGGNNPSIRLPLLRCIIRESSCPRAICSRGEDLPLQLCDCERPV